MEVKISNLQLQMTFALADGKFVWQSLKSASGTEFLTPEQPSLWEIEFLGQDKEVALYTANSLPEVVREGDAVLMNWQLPVASVQVKIVLPDDTDAANMTIDITGVAKNVCIRQVRFPSFNWQLEKGEDCKLTVPADAGCVYPDPLTTLPVGGIYELKNLRRRQWPNGHLTLQFLALNRGKEQSYFASHDLTASLKSFDWEVDREKACITLRPFWRTPLIPGASYASFPWVAAVSEGDWFDASMRYREYALKAPWMKNGPLEYGKKTPQWMIETPLVTLRHSRGKGWEPDDLKAEADYFQLPMLVHYYDWHAVRGANFPLQPGAAKAFRQLNEYGIRFMPYTDAYSNFSDVPVWKDQQSAAIHLNEKGDKHAITWPPHYTTLVSMCPGSLLWRDSYTNTAMRLISLGASAIYFDEYCMSPPWTCCAEHHEHIPGDPTSYIRDVNSLMEEIKLQANDLREDGVVFANEGACEPMLCNVDSSLIGNDNSPYMKPVFSAVYHDYIMGYGRYIFYLDLTDDRFSGALETKFAEQFICGWQIGWSRVPWNMVIEKYPETASFIRMLAQVRRDHCKYLACGKMLRPLELEVATFKQLWAKSWNDKTGLEVTLPEVFNSIWQVDDTTLEAFFVNVTNHEVTFSFVMPSEQLQATVEEKQYHSPTRYRRKNTRVYPMPEPMPVYGELYTPDGRSKRFIMDGDTGNGFTFTIPPRSVLVQMIPTSLKDGVIHSEC